MGDANPHRTLHLTSPLMDGPDIRAFQKALDVQAKLHNLDSIAVDGEYGSETREAYRQVGFYLGFLEKTLDEGATVAAQRLVADPSKRNKAQIGRARKREQSMQRPEALIEWAKQQVGVKEHPPNSNTGPKVSKFEKEFGTDGVPWCGAFVGFGLKHVGVPVNSRVLFCPFIEADARSHTNGFAKFVGTKDAKPGDLVLYDFGASSVPQHVGIVVAIDRPDGVLHTIEGNTSAGMSGSQDNGGGVFARSRPLGGTIMGFARPRYAHAA